MKKLNSLKHEVLESYLDGDNQINTSNNNYPYTDKESGKNDYSIQNNDLQDSQYIEDNSNIQNNNQPNDSTILTESIDSSSVFKILVATDNHIGYLEHDQLRGDDSFNAFEEILIKAKSLGADFLLLGGDLFHQHNPSKKTIIRTSQILNSHIFGNQKHRFETLNFKANYLTEQHHNIALPIFIIHGNHDDPSGLENFSSIDIFSNKEMNYFGKINNVEEFEVSPILFKKNETKVALYGIGNIKDERLYAALQNKKVVFHRPRDADKWFSILVVHQNRFRGHYANKSRKNYLPESFIPEFFDLVVWGHEHESFTEPVYNSEMGFHIYQPGSSVATSLIGAEAKTKHIGMLEVYKDNFRLTAKKLETVRPFVYDSFELKERNITNNDEIEYFITEKLVEALEKGFAMVEENETGWNRELKKIMEKNININSQNNNNKKEQLKQGKEKPLKNTTKNNQNAKITSFIHNKTNSTNSNVNMQNEMNADLSITENSQYQMYKSISSEGNLESHLLSKLNSKITSLVERYKSNQLLPLIRLKIETSGFIISRTNQIVSRFTQMVANPYDVLQFYKKPDPIILKKKPYNVNELEIENVSTTVNLDEETVDLSDELKKFLVKSMQEEFAENNKKLFVFPEPFLDSVEAHVNGNKKSLENLFSNLYNSISKSSKGMTNEKINIGYLKDYKTDDSLPAKRENGKHMEAIFREMPFEFLNDNTSPEHVEDQYSQYIQYNQEGNGKKGNDFFKSKVSEVGPLEERKHEDSTLMELEDNYGNVNQNGNRVNSNNNNDNVFKYTSNVNGDFIQGYNVRNGINGQIKNNGYSGNVNNENMNQFKGINNNFNNKNNFNLNNQSLQSNQNRTNIPNKNSSLLVNQNQNKNMHYFGNRKKPVKYTDTENDFSMLKDNMNSNSNISEQTNNFSNLNSNSSNFNLTNQHEQVNIDNINSSLANLNKNNKKKPPVQSNINLTSFSNFRPVDSNVDSTKILKENELRVKENIYKPEFNELDMIMDKNYKLVDLGLGGNRNFINTNKSSKLVDTSSTSNGDSDYSVLRKNVFQGLNLKPPQDKKK